MSESTKSIISVIVAVLLSAFLSFLFWKQEGFKQGLGAGWDLAVEQCQKDKTNCVPLGQVREFR